MRFAEKLRALLDRRRMSYAALVKAAGGMTSTTTVQAWLKAGRVPSLDQIEAVARALGVPVAYLADDEVEDPEGEAGRRRSAAEESSRRREEAGAIDEARYVEIGRSLGMRDAADLMVVVSKLGVVEATRRLMLQAPAAATFEDEDPAVDSSPPDPAPGRRRADRRRPAADGRRSAVSP